MISVLLPSREREDQLAVSVSSLVSNAASTRRVEVLVVADKDDLGTINAAAALDPPVRVLVTSRKGYDGLHEYYQLAAAAAHGDWLMVWNDDAVMMTPGWNAIIESLPPSVLVADIASTQSPLCCFPAVRREAVAALGRFSSANPHVDTWWQDVGQAAGVIESVPCFASHDSPIKWGENHGFYSQAHQLEIAEAAVILRSAMAKDGQ